MSVFDKYDPISGGFRAPLAADYTTAELAQAVSLNASGRVVVGTAGQSGFVGVICMGRTMKAGEIIDVMTHGEIVEFPTVPAGSQVFANADGTFATAAPGAGVNADKVGWTVEAGRLVVRAERVQG